MTRILSSIAAVCALCACGHGNDKATESEGDEHEHGADEIVLSEADAERFGVETEAVTPTPFADVVRVSGEVLPSTADRVVVSARKAGIVHFANGITQGATVKAGQGLATVTAENVAGGDANASAKAALDAAKRELERVTPLYAEGIVTKKEYNDALAAYEAAKIAYAPGAVGGGVSAPRAGVITAISATDGSFVETGAPILEIASNNTLTLRALLPVSEASFLPRIKSAVITPHGGEGVSLDSLGGRLLSARAATSGDVPGYIPVYFTFEGKNPEIVAGSAAEVYLTSQPREEVLSVPVEALTEQLGNKFVFVKVSGHTYEKRAVKTGRSDGLRTEITDGIAAGDSVVCKGTTFVRLAQQSTVVPEGHSHNH